MMFLSKFKLVSISYTVLEKNHFSKVMFFFHSTADDYKSKSVTYITHEGTAFQTTNE